MRVSLFSKNTSKYIFNIGRRYYSPPNHEVQQQQGEMEQMSLVQVYLMNV